MKRHEVVAASVRAEFAAAGRLWAAAVMEVVVFKLWLQTGPSGLRCHFLGEQLLRLPQHCGGHIGRLHWKVGLVHRKWKVDGDLDLATVFVHEEGELHL